MRLDRPERQVERLRQVFVPLPAQIMRRNQEPPRRRQLCERLVEPVAQLHICKCAVRRARINAWTAVVVNEIFYNAPDDLDDQYA